MYNMYNTITCLQDLQEKTFGVFNNILILSIPLYLVFRDVVCWVKGWVVCFISLEFLLSSIKHSLLFICFCSWLIFIFISGEGFHNYHHTFPYDYATSEYGSWLNFTKVFIDFMCYVGLAQDRKKPPHDTIIARVHRTGDGSHKSG